MDYKKRGFEDVDWVQLAQIGSSGGSCEHGSRFLGCIKDVDFPD
jgi:hypothetical protein